MDVIGSERSFMVNPMRGIFVWLIVFSLAGGVMASTTQAQLDQALETLQTKQTALDQIVSSLKIGQAFLSVGIATGTANGQVTLPINFVQGPSPIAAVQGTLVLGSGITAVSMTAGQSAITAGKSVSLSGLNFIIFGINQIAIGQGDLVNLMLSLPASLRNGFYTITIVNPVASDANGNAVLLNTISGTVRIGL